MTTGVERYPPFSYVVHIDTNGEVTNTSRSQGLDRIIGVPVEEIEAQGGLRSFVHPDDLVTAMGAIDQLLAGDTWEGDIRVRTATGEHRWLHLYSEAQRLDDGAVRVEGWATTPPTPCR